MTDHATEAKRILNEPAFGYAEGNDPHGAAQAHATLALVEVTERLAVAQETANDLAFNARITSLPDGIRNAIDPAVIERAVRAGQRAMKAMGL